MTSVKLNKFLAECGIYQGAPVRELYYPSNYWDDDSDFNEEEDIDEEQNSDDEQEKPRDVGKQNTKAVRKTGSGSVREGNRRT